ncbi:MAG: thioredoxin family protein [Alphaproteobacteria bacterium]|nr:thioredoxin family protein [Alphaproteobacteria bacterium]
MRLTSLAIIGVCVIWASGVGAQPASDWARADFVDVRLVSAVAGTEGRDTVPLGLEFRLAEGWKVYWRSAGDAGYPPQVTWDASRNLAAADTAYPVPHRFSLFGLETFGYKDHVVYPITARLIEPGAPLRVDAAVNALVCSDICVPLDINLRLDLPNGPPSPTAFTQLLDRWTAQVPRDLPGLGLDVTAVRLTGDPASPTLEIAVVSEGPIGDLDVFPEGPKGTSFGKPEVVAGAAPDGVTLRVPVGLRQGARIDGAALTLTLVDGDRFVERRITVGATAGARPTPPMPTPPPVDVAGFLAMLGVAVLGGLILNLMPCVLPVLSLKLVSAVGYGGAARGAIRAGFLASAAGILFSFLVLAAGAIGLREAGVAVGWGIQFQQPLFLVAMTALVVLFAANLWGVFEVPLPRTLADLGARLPSEQRPNGGKSLVGHFLTGAFVTLLATPCSAPFVGTAIGFALSRGSGEVLAVFAAMGLGLALPYLVVAAAPGLVRALPRPGPWMVWLKKILALALVATAAWLLTVLAAQIGMTMSVVVAGVFLALVVVLWLAPEGLAVPGAGVAVLAALLIAGVAERPRALGPVAEATTANGVTTVAWRPFDQAGIKALVAEGRVVLVDVTADWCLTCRVNKKLVLDTQPVAGLLASGEVAAVRADWTNPDPIIATYLASFGRYGIPFNAVYGPGAPEGIPLPELLSVDAVLDAVARAGAGAGADKAPRTARLD